MYGRKADGNILILALDLACVAASLGIGFGARYGRLYGVRGHWDMVWMLVLFLVAYTALALLLDFHRHFFRRGAVDELRQVLKGQLLLYLAMLAILYAMHRSDDLSRMVSAYFLVLNTALTYAARLLFRQLMLKGYRRSRYSSRLLLVAGMADAEGAIGDILRYNEWFRQLSGVALVDDPGLDLVAASGWWRTGGRSWTNAVHNGWTGVHHTGGSPDRGGWEDVGPAAGAQIGDHGERRHQRVRLRLRQETLGRVGEIRERAFARNAVLRRELAAKRHGHRGRASWVCPYGRGGAFSCARPKAGLAGPRCSLSRYGVGRNGRKFTFYKVPAPCTWNAEQRS